MRAFFSEGDLLVAEVQAFFADGAMSLHTRSLKYGKVHRLASPSPATIHPPAQLRNGILVVVPPSLIVRLKSHFHTLPCGVDLILGLNGHVWVSATTGIGSALAHTEASVDAEHTTSASLYSNLNDPITADRREAVARVAAVVRALAAARVPITDAAVAEAYEASLEHDDDMQIDSGRTLKSAYPVKNLTPGEEGAARLADAVARGRA
jgi:exosome complex component RRP4